MKLIVIHSEKGDTVAIVKEHTWLELAGIKFTVIQPMTKTPLLHDNPNLLQDASYLLSHGRMPYQYEIAVEQQPIPSELKPQMIYTSSSGGGDGFEGGLYYDEKVARQTAYNEVHRFRQQVLKGNGEIKATFAEYGVGFRIDFDTDEYYAVTVVEPRFYA